VFADGDVERRRRSFPLAAMGHPHQAIREGRPSQFEGLRDLAQRVDYGLDKGGLFLVDLIADDFGETTGSLPCLHPRLGMGDVRVEAA
jgi:hypothetical protein